MGYYTADDFIAQLLPDVTTEQVLEAFKPLTDYFGNCVVTVEPTTGKTVVDLRGGEITIEGGWVEYNFNDEVGYSYDDAINAMIPEIVHLTEPFIFNWHNHDESESGFYGVATSRAAARRVEFEEHLKRSIGELKDYCPDIEEPLTALANLTYRG